MGRVGVGRVLSNRQSGREVKGRSLVYLFPGTVVAKYHEKAEIYSLAALEARSPESRCQQGHAPSEASRGGSFLASSSLRWPQAFLGLGWQISPSLSVFTWPPSPGSVSSHDAVHSVCGSGSKFPSSYKDTSHIWI